MAKLIIYINLLIVTLVFLCCKQAGKELTGVWKGLDEKGEIGFLIMDKDHYITIITGGDTMKGTGYQSTNGKIITSKYTVDFSKDPISLDIKTFDKETGDALGVMKAIIRFPESNLMELRSNFNDQRPERFDDTQMENTFLFTKIE